MDPALVHPRVKDAVRAWGAAPDLARAAEALDAARRTLEPELIAQLVDEVAEISAELMVEVIAMESGVDTDAAPIDVLGLSLYPKQTERLAAWLEDQAPTAAALGLERDAWVRQIEKGFERYLARARGEGDAPPAEITDGARRLLGDSRTAFEARPAPGASPRAGLSGLLAARGFDKKK